MKRCKADTPRRERKTRECGETPATMENMGMTCQHKDLDPPNIGHRAGSGGGVGTGSPTASAHVASLVEVNTRPPLV